MSLGFSSSVSPIMEGIVDLHNHIFFFLVLIFVFVFWLFSQILLRFWWAVHQPNGDPLADRPSLVTLRHLNHSTLLEIVWTVVPSLILVAVAVPSFALLYAMDEVLEPTLTLKAVGHQWYWSYQYSNCVASLHYVPLEQPELVPISLWDQIWRSVLLFTLVQADNYGPYELTTAPYPLDDEDPFWFRHWWIRKFTTAKVLEALSAPVTLVEGSSLPAVAFDSYMLSEEELVSSGDYRLLQVDEPVVLPANTHVRLLVTAEDVIHSFALPSAGVKLDAVPGRLNQQGLFLKRQGTFYGQCSELCGVNHGFMPIVVKGVSLREFVHWYLTKLQLQHPSVQLELADPTQVREWLTTGRVPDGTVKALAHPPHPQAAVLDAANGLVLHKRVEEVLEEFLEVTSKEFLDYLWNREIPDLPWWAPPVQSGFRLGADVPHPFPTESFGAYQSISLSNPGSSRWW
jgi:heme/copper-type cytochrome/quinol oxidase subunit 2